MSAVAEAREAARAGALSEAERLLAGESSLAALDLLARVQAQQGKLTEADRSWAAVQEQSPANPAALAGRALIKEIQEGRRKPRPLVTAGRATAALVLAFALLTTAAVWPNPSQQPQAAPRPSPPTVTAQPTQSTAEPLTDLAAALTIPGAQTKAQEDGVQIVFEVGVFNANATTPNREGEALLTAVAAKLATLDVVTTVVGHAAQVPGGPTAGGEPIALTRAQAAAELMSAASGLPLTAFTLTTADQSAGPYPDQARNRTVTLLVTPSR